MPTHVLVHPHVANGHIPPAYLPAKCYVVVLHGSHGRGHVHLYVCACMYACICICACIHLCMCARVRVFMYLCSERLWNAARLLSTRSCCRVPTLCSLSAPSASLARYAHAPVPCVPYVHAPVPCACLFLHACFALRHSWQQHKGWIHFLLFKRPLVRTCFTLCMRRLSTWRDDGADLTAFHASSFEA
jgi:hypothetical protein